MTWLDLQVSPTTVFVDWLDRECRERSIRAAVSRVRRASDVDLYESWGGLLLYVHKHGMTAMDFGDEAQLRAWVVSFVIRGVRYIEGHRRQLRTYTAGTHPVVVQLMSELEAEEVEQKLEHASRQKPQHRDELGPSQPPWFSTLLEQLTPIQQEAVQLCLIAGYSSPEVARMLGVSKEAIKARLKAARAPLRKHAMMVA